MIEWIKQLTPEFYIIVGFLLILFILLIIQIIRLTLVSRRLGTQDFKIIEAISKNDDGDLFLQITVSNLAFSTNNLNKIGFKNKSVIHVLSEVNKLIPPRNKHVEVFNMEHIESITITDKKKYKKVKIYAENDLGDKQQIKAKVTNKHLKLRHKENKKALRKAAKAERFDTGNYNFWERLGLILRLFGRPFYKLNRKIKRSTNNALKESEVRRKQKAEHDKIENELNQTAARTRNIQIEEESKRYNKTRETELELLKQQKVLEIEKRKRDKYLKAYEARKAELEAIDVDVEVEKHFDENPINYDEIDQEILAKASKEQPNTSPKKNKEKEPIPVEEEKTDSLKQPKAPSKKNKEKEVKEEPAVENETKKASNKKNDNKDKKKD